MVVPREKSILKCAVSGKKLGILALGILLAFLVHFSQQIKTGILSAAFSSGCILSKAFDIDGGGVRLF
jgi:hypothetical protein